MPDAAFAVIPRAEWGAKHGRGPATAGAKSLVVVHNDSVDSPSRSRVGMTVEEESRILRVYEDFHARTLTPADPRIGYNFVVMQTGRIYEGVGWGRIGAHVKNMNSKAVGWCFAINGAATEPTPDAVNAFRWHVAEGVRLGHLAGDVAVKGHQDFNKPSCPGGKLYRAAVLKFAPWTVRPAKPRPLAPRVVWSEYEGDWLVAVKVVSDAEWYFVRASDLGGPLAGRLTKSTQPLSRMESAP